MNFKLFCVVIILYLNQLSPCFSKEIPYYFKQINAEMGLSQNSVLGIIQDRQGFMWFATKDGVNRYDGKHFKSYSPDNTNGILQDCVINVLCEASDGNMWIGTNKGVSIYNPQTESFERFEINVPQKDIVRNSITSIKEDRNGNIWIADLYRGVFHYNPKKETLNRLNNNDSIAVKHPQSILEDKRGNIWVGTNGYGLFLFDTESGLLKPYKILNSNNIKIENLHISSILESGRDIYLGTFHNGFLKLNTETQQLSEVLGIDKRPSPSHIHVLERVNVHEIWIGTELGLYIYNERQKTYSAHIKQSYVDKFALSDISIRSIFKDKDNGIWVGSYFGGVNYLPYQQTPFKKYYPLNDGKTVSGKAIRDICEDQEGFIWIGTEDSGLDRFDPQKEEFKHYGALGQDINLYNSIHALKIDGDKLWIGTFAGGLDLMNIKTGKIKHYMKDKVPVEVFSLLKDRIGNLWFGTHQGAFIYDKENDNFKKVEEIPDFFMYDIKEDHLGNIWFAAISNGAICYNPETKNIIHYKHNSKDESSIATKVIGIFEDSMNRLWFTTEGWGFCRFNSDTGNFKRYTIANGLPNSVVYYITEDHQGKLWLGTNKGLVNFDPDTEKMQVYTHQDGLLCDQFNYKSAFTAKDGTIYMGTQNGFISFNPLTFRKDTPTSFHPVITGFQIFNKEVEIGSNSPLSKSISLTQEIVLTYKQHTLSFDIASLNYNLGTKNLYMYQLKGVDKEWFPLKEDQKLMYSNLSPGKYELHIKAINDNIERCYLKIIINPPFWQSSIACALYSILLLLISFYIYRKSSLRIKKKHQHLIEKMEAQKEKETYDVKIAFFTNVAHEIRTPLTLIKGPLEHILAKNKVDKEIKEDLLIMQRNSDRLHTLINQLLDFRKTESGKLCLSFFRQNIVSLIRKVAEQFSPTLRHKNIDIRLLFSSETFYADVDVEAFTKIISNLFANASKFSQSYIEIELVENIQNNMFVLFVKNDGEIIIEEMFDKIFEPFFQIDSKNRENMKTGTGIGLPLSRSLVELHGGKLSIKNESPAYNTFVLELPINQIDTSIKHEETEEEKSNSFQEESSMKAKQERPSILIVEDNIEMQNFIGKQLRDSYVMHYAYNGKKALEILNIEHISLIISDIAMPEMDGLELLSNIKSNVKYSHIPTILLTARTSLQSKTEGLKQGADAYIEKPFSMEFLLVQITNLLEGRKKLRDSFINSPYLHSNTIALTKADEEFMEKVNEIVEQNIDNINFNIEQLANAMNSSRSSLLRKMKGISGLTVNEYIRLIRLKKAAQLLGEYKYRINEVCILTGFSSSSYFAKCFQKQFGILPKDFADLQ